MANNHQDLKHIIKESFIYMEIHFIKNNPEVSYFTFIYLSIPI